MLRHPSTLAVLGLLAAFVAAVTLASEAAGTGLIPGEIICAEGEITLNEGRDVITLTAANTGDRPVQIGGHYHFAEANPAVDFDREAARGMRLDIAAGTAVRFEPGQTRDVQLIPFAGSRRVVGFNGQVMGRL